ncbi:MAG TPA: hypothetical protein PLX85_00030 [Dehalococcoidia bacterium]|nr:hypothetical protein [Dehalococcoidia bacterium]
MGVAGSATLRSHWHLSGHEVTEDRFRQCLARAEQCCDFQPASHVSKNFTRDDGRSYAVPEWVLAITTPGDILTLEMADEPKWYVNGNRVIGPR